VEIPDLISEVYSALMRVTNGEHVAAPAAIGVFQTFFGGNQ